MALLSFLAPTPAVTFAGSAMPRTETMSVKDWIAVTTNPRQRPTVEQLEKGIKGHLFHPSVSQAVTHAARLPDGSLVKLDGHTRALAWESNLLESPPFVLVVVYPVSDIEQAKELYTHFDGLGPVETVHQQIGGGMRENNIVFESSFCKRRKFSNALRYASGNSLKTPYEQVTAWKDELLMIDALDVNAKMFNSGITLAAILTGNRNPGMAYEFWVRYKTTDGRENDFGVCPIAALKRKVEQIMTEGTFGGGRDRMFAIAQHALWCFEKFLEDPSVMLRKSGRRGSISISDYRALLGFAS